jgi:transposase-like protein
MESFEVVTRKGRRDLRGRETVADEVKVGLLAEFDSSDLSQAAFARRSGVHYSTFAGWVQRRRKSTKATTDTPHTLKTTKSTTEGSQADPFQELRIESPGLALAGNAGGCGGLTVVLPGGVEVRGCDTRSAVDLIRALREVG